MPTYGLERLFSEESILIMTDNVKSEENPVHEELWSLATAVRDACFSAAVTAYEDARIDGLCHDGAWECALAAMRTLNFESIVSKVIAQR
jgi:hypothetical protein